MQVEVEGDRGVGKRVFVSVAGKGGVRGGEGEGNGEEEGEGEGERDSTMGTTGPEVM